MLMGLLKKSFESRFSLIRSFLAAVEVNCDFRAAVAGKRVREAGRERNRRLKLIPAQQINEAYERMLKSDVQYRFVIDSASLAN